MARVGVEPTGHQGLSLAALPVCVPCRLRSLRSQSSQPPMGFEPTVSTLTGWRALRAAPRGQYEKKTFRQMVCHRSKVVSIGKPPALTAAIPGNLVTGMATEPTLLRRTSRGTGSRRLSFDRIVRWLLVEIGADDRSARLDRSYSVHSIIRNHRRRVIVLAGQGRRTGPVTLIGWIMDEQIAEILGRKYRIALAAATILVLGNQAMVQPYLMQLTTDAPLINVAGRQRMLSQRLAKAALAFGGEQRGGGRGYLEEMREVLGLWSTAHEQLLRGGASPWWAGRNSAAVRDGLRGLEPHFVKMRDAARQVIRAGESGRPDFARVREGVAVIRDNEAEYLRRMDRVVGLYESEARGRVDNLRRISWAVTALTLATLAAIGLFIVRPAARLIRRQISELGQARDELEAQGPGADPRVGGRRRAAPGACRAVQSRRADDHDRRDGQRAGPRAQPAARGHRQLRRGLSGRARGAASGSGGGPGRAGATARHDAPRRTDHRPDTQVRDPPGAEARAIRAEPGRRGGRGDPPRRGRTAGSRRSARSGTRFAQAVGRSCPDPAGAGESGAERIRRTRGGANLSADVGYADTAGRVRRCRVCRD